MVGTWQWGRFPADTPRVRPGGVMKNRAASSTSVRSRPLRPIAASDFVIESSGADVFIVGPCNRIAADWLSTSLDPSLTRIGEGVTVEGGRIRNFITRISAAGFTVQLRVLSQSDSDSIDASQEARMEPDGACCRKCHAPIMRGRTIVFPKAGGVEHLDCAKA